jgi:ubiquinone/menaquinone biosynthesis C-methylase UbiE
MSEVERIRAEYERRERTIAAARYSAAEPAPMLMRQARERGVLRMLRSAGVLPLTERSVLEVGCGGGQWLVDFETWGARRSNLYGIDLIGGRADVARARLPGATIEQGDASTLPWLDASFDIVLQSTAFSSILDDGMRADVAQEMARVLRPAGVVLWNDLRVNNPRNPHVRGIPLPELRRLFPDFTIDARRITLLPPLARRLAPRAPLLVQLLEDTRLLNTHLLAVLRRRGPDG